MADGWMWFYLFNLIVNSFLSFVTTAALVALFVVLLRIKDQRIISFAIAIPLLKLCVDPFLYDFSISAFFNQMNPFDAVEGSRTFAVHLGVYPWLATAFQFSLSNGQTFSLADLMILSVDPFWIKLAVISMGVGLIYYLSIFFYQLKKSFLDLSLILLHAAPLFKKKGVLVLSSAAIDVPFAVGIVRKKIVFPERLLKELSAEEFEAITCHEMEHLRFHDGALRLFSSALKALYWWLPLKRWVSRLELAQEKGCDAAVKKPFELAQAILKTIKFSKDTPRPLHVCLATEKPLKERFQSLLNERKPKNPLIIRWGQNLLLASVLMAIFLGKFWIY